MDPRLGRDGGWCAIDPTDKNTLYAESQYGRIVRSYTGGGSFSQATVGLPGSQSEWNFIPPFVIAPSSPNVLYAGSRNVYKTTNYGSSWVSANGSASLNGTNVACIGVSWTSPDTLLAGTGSGAVGAAPLFQIFASTTGGASWATVTAGLPDRYPTDIEFDPSDSRIAYLTYSDTDRGICSGQPISVRLDRHQRGPPDIRISPSPSTRSIRVSLRRHRPRGVSEQQRRRELGTWADGMPDAMIPDLVVTGQ